MRVVDKNLFMDVVSGSPVGIYQDRSTGKYYLAEGPWAFFRLEWPYKPKETKFPKEG